MSEQPPPESWPEFTAAAMDATLALSPDGTAIVKALIPWAKRNGIDPDALPAMLNLALLQQVMLTHGVNAPEGGRDGA